MKTAHRRERLPKAPGAGAEVDARATFITRVYLHLLLAIFLFVGSQFALFGTGAADVITRAVVGERWPLAFAAFLVVAWFARRGQGEDPEVAIPGAGRLCRGSGDDLRAASARPPLRVLPRGC